MSTNLNSSSSRSHAVITFHVTTRLASSNESGEQLEQFSKLNVVDLAGSERVKDSGVSGVNLREACNINLSLFNLARVVQALADGGKPPHTNDPLCSLLKDALGGNCVTTLVATVSPAQLHARETVGKGNTQKSQCFRLFLSFKIYNISSS